MEPSGDFREVFIELREKYEKACLLIEEESKSDPENAPYRSKYAASKILTEMKSKLVNILDDINAENSDYVTVKAMLGIVWLLLGTVSLDTEELSTGEEQLMKCVECLSDDALRPEYIISQITALNQLGLLWSQRDQPKKSQEFLEQAETLYKTYSKEINLPAIDAPSIFKATVPETYSSGPGTSLEKTHTLTLYYLAQIYGALSDNRKSAIYCHTTLKRQLETKDFDPIDWALNAATLSQYLMEKVGFKEARHHLAAASFILDQYEGEMGHMNCNEEELAARGERLAHRRADVTRCWAKYGLLLLSNSKERLMEQGETTNQSEEVEQMNENGDVLFAFSSLEVNSYEDQITDKYILTFDDARKVFLKTQEWLNEAKQYYTLDSHASDYVQIVQDHSQLFSHLAFFEDDEERQSRMHKRRVDLLESVLQQLNPQYYMLVCRQLWYELALTYSDILDIKLERLQASDSRPTPHALRKINHLASSSIANFTHFLDSLKDPSTKEFPDTISEDLERPALNAHCHIGRLYSKLVTPDKKVNRENIKKSIDAYQFIVDYCEKHESGRQKMSVELGVCQEMVQLLPLKLEKLTQDVK
ncbi:KIF-binding protein [Schistocerca piceifrons]|uniref:KIF-binding protein n=1 Tax=Schistocerca piceifrons TaxID=274613 RepID=UPI001F5F84E6|nr:KIF-binding protein [Schistocerca piceifrons]